MREYYHATVVKLLIVWRMIVNIPNIIKWDDEDLGRKDLIVILKRVTESRYYHKHAEQQACGCFAVGSRYTSYMADCEYHGLGELFPGTEE